MSFLHGHKHYPEALTTGAALTENPQLVLSGGTIGGGEATGKSAGFYIIDYSTDNKTLHPMFVELQPTGNPKAVVGNAIRHQPVEISADGGDRAAIKGAACARLGIKGTSQ